LTGTAPAVTATSTQIVLTTAGATVDTGAQRTITLNGLSLGGARSLASGGFRLSSSVDTGLSVGVDAPAINIDRLIFSSISSGGVSGSAFSPVLVFTPKTTVPPGGKITLSMPPGYFVGSVSSITSTVPSLTVASSTSATSTSTSIVLTTGGVETGTNAQITMTLTGLTLGGARAVVAAGFRLSTSEDTELTTGIDAAVITGILFNSITSGGAAGTAMNPVLVFTPANNVQIGGTITLFMPAGYFLGSVTSIASNVISLTATSTGPAATATNTSIVLTTAGAATGTSAITMTLTGLKLGTAREAVIRGFQMSTSTDPGLSIALASTAITAPANPTTPAASLASVSVVSLVSYLFAVFITFAALE